MHEDSCPKCGRNLRDPYNEGFYLSSIMQYLGVREQHMFDDPVRGGCNWAWADLSKLDDKVYRANTQKLVDKHNELKYKGPS